MEDALKQRAFDDRSGEEVRDAFVAEAAKSDPHAFGELYDRYYDRVYRYVYHRVGHPSDAEDITGLVFMKALEAIPSYRTGKNGFAPSSVGGLCARKNSASFCRCGAVSASCASRSACTTASPVFLALA